MSPTFPLLPQGAVPTARTWGAFFSGKEPAPHPGRKAPGRFDFALDPQRHKGRGLRPSPFGNPLPGTGDGGEAPAFGNPSRSWTGERQRKKGRGRPVWNIGVRRTFWCGDTVLGGIGIAQPVGDFWIWSAVCDGQPPVLDDLTPSCQITPQRFFFCTVSGTFSFWQDKKEMWGTFCTAKSCLPVPHSGTVVHPCGDSPHILGPPFQGEPFKGALQWPNVNPPPI